MTAYRWVSAFGYQLLPVAALFGAVRSSGVVGIDEKYVLVPKNDKPEGKMRRWMYVYLAVDSYTYDLLHIEIYPFNTKQSARAFLLALRAKGYHPRVVVTDMRTDYRDVVSQVFPRAVHHQCIFHALQEVREQAKEAYGTNYAETCPEVERLLDEIDAIFDARTKRTAQRRYEKVLAQRHHFEADNPAASAIFDFLERQPVLFLGREIFSHLESARQTLAQTLNTEAENIVYFPNTTLGVNLVARSLNLQSGDEVLSTNHEYGACDKIWKFVCQKIGASYIRQPISLPVTSSRKIVDEFWEGVTAQTKIIFISHITSETALQMLVEEICKLARKSGILTLVDGAHAPGHFSLDLGEIGADFYVGNCHKWMLSPKGAAFLQARPGGQALLSPLVVSWGWGEDSPFGTGSSFLDSLQWSGTDDPSAYLSVPAAIQFQKDHNWLGVRKRCHQLLEHGLERALQITEMPSVYPQGERLYHQMAVVPLPRIDDLESLQKMLYREYKIEIPAIEWQGKQFLRLSVQAYNTEEDLEIFLRALEELLEVR